MKLITVLDGEGFKSQIWEYPDGMVRFIGDADIDADGCPYTYHPLQSKGLDLHSNAKTTSGKWVGVLTDKTGKPMVAGPNDLAPGFYISTTRYEWQDQPRGTQRRYVDSSLIPFIVVPPIVIKATKGVVMGCRCEVTNWLNGRKVEGMVADSGPSRKTGEVSMRMAELLGIDPDPKKGGQNRPVIEYKLWPGVPAVIDGKLVKLQPS